MPFQFSTRPYVRLLLRTLALAALLGTGLWVRTLQPMELAAGGLGGWWPWAPPTTATLYFADGPFLFPVSRSLPAADAGPRAVLQALLDGPDAASALASAIPEGVEIRSFDLAGGVARVDLSAAFLGEDGETAAAETALVATMTALSDVRSVVLSIEGEPVSGPLSRVPLLYYASANGLAAVPGGAGTPRAALEDYIAGLPPEGLTGLPGDVRLLSYEYDPARALVSLDFTYTASVRALAIEQPDRMRFVLLGLIASLTEFPGVRAVQIDFQGQTRLGLGQCSDLLRIPQPRPRLLNDERLLRRL